jgi:hypothetical protein
MIAPSLTAVPVIAFTMAAVAASDVAIATFIQRQPTKPIRHTPCAAKSLARLRAAADFGGGRSHPINVPPVLASFAQAFIARAPTALSP